MSLVTYFRINLYHHYYSDWPPEVWIVLGIILVLSWLYKMYFSRRAVVRRKLRSMGVKKIADIEEGEMGRVTAAVALLGRKLKAPLSGRRCSFYHVRVDEKRSSGKHTHWVKIIDEEMVGDVILHDGDNYVIVKTSLIKAFLLPDMEYRTGFLKDPSEAQIKFLKHHGHDCTDFFGMNKGIQYQEGVLEANEIVSVMGKASWKSTDEFQIKIPARKVLVLEEHEEEPVYLSDDPDAIE